MVKKITLWAAVIICMGMIFSFSAQTSDQSNELSNSLLDEIIRFFAVGASENTIEFLSVFIRKVAHFSEYALLGALIFLLMRVGYGVEGKWGAIMPPVFSLLYAVTDEIHQLFVGGRSCQITDVAIDTLGAIAGTLLFVLIFTRLERRKK